MDPAMPATLDAALATEPAWLQAWVMLLVATHLSALAFVVKRVDGRLRPRPEAIAIVASFVLAGIAMNVLYQQVGYVRLLGLAHLVFWGPVWLWVLGRRPQAGSSLFGWYLPLYLTVAGASLLIDMMDLVRWLLGDGQLLGRHG